MKIYSYTRWRARSVAPHVVASLLARVAGARPVCPLGSPLLGRYRSMPLRAARCGRLARFPLRGRAARRRHSSATLRRCAPFVAPGSPPRVPALSRGAGARDNSAPAAQYKAIKSTRARARAAVRRPALFAHVPRVDAGRHDANSAPWIRGRQQREGREGRAFHAPGSPRRPPRKPIKTYTLPTPRAPNAPVTFVHTTFVSCPFPERV